MIDVVTVELVDERSPRTPQRRQEEHRQREQRETCGNRTLHGVAGGPPTSRGYTDLASSETTP